MFLKENVDYRYRNDAFDLRRASENPLIENQVGKKDWALSNKCVGFNYKWIIISFNIINSTRDNLLCNYNLNIEHCFYTFS